METEGPSPLSEKHFTLAISMQGMSQTDFLDFEFNITLQFIPSSSKLFLSLGFPQQNHICSSPHSCYMHRPIILLYLVRNVHETSHYSVYFNSNKTAAHNCYLRSTAVYFSSAATEASNKTFHWLIAFHPNLTCPVALHILHCISLVPNFSRDLIDFVFNFNFCRLAQYICVLTFAKEHYITSI